MEIQSPAASMVPTMYALAVCLQTGWKKAMLSLLHHGAGVREGGGDKGLAPPVADSGGPHRQPRTVVMPSRKFRKDAAELAHLESVGGAQQYPPKREAADN